jgi:hypothetical protein|tara:strand:- start:96 stop:371 length:276 start_codon:yes stop_codon:yes gene_type:complete
MKEKNIKDWSDKRVEDMTTKDKVDMVESFAGALCEFSFASKSGDEKVCEEIFQVLLYTFALFALENADQKNIEELLKTKNLEFFKKFGASA